MSSEDSLSLGRQLRARRAASGRTVAAVAAEAGLSVPYIANLENDRGNPTVGALDKLARALGTSLQVALVDDGTPKLETIGSPARIDRLARHPRLAAEVQHLAAVTGAPEDRIRQHLLDLILALSRLKGSPPTPVDIDRTLDLAVLVLRPDNEVTARSR